jgi:polycomb group RING finger protein 4
MDLSADLKAGLNLLANVQLFNPAAFAAVVKITVVEVLVKGGHAGALLEAAAPLKAVDARVLKHVHGAVATLFLEAARQSYDDELMGSLLTENGFGPKQAELLSEVFRTQRDALRELLARSSFHFPHIVDVDWRMDYHIRSARVEKVDHCHWLIALKTVQPSGELKDVKFACNREELQDLLAKLKVCSFHVFPSVLCSCTAQDALGAAERLTATE